MTEMNCRCGYPFDLTREPRFCADCGAPLPLTDDELAACSAELSAMHEAILAAVLDLTNVGIAGVEGEAAWTRIDPRGFSIVAWFRHDDPKAGVHGIETSPLRRGGFSLTSSADEVKERRHTIPSIAELENILPMLLDK